MSWFVGGGSWKHSHAYYQLITVDDCLYATIAELRAPASVEPPTNGKHWLPVTYETIWGHMLWKLQTGRQHCWNKSQAQTASPRGGIRTAISCNIWPLGGAMEGVPSSTTPIFIRNPPIMSFLQALKETGHHFILQKSSFALKH